MRAHLFNIHGERFFFNEEERAAFIEAANRAEDDKTRTFCSLLHYTGCNFTEAMNFKPPQVDCPGRAIVFPGPHNSQFSRSIPVPDSFIELLDHQVALALLDQSLVAGLGNIYAAESLWRARISPFTPCNTIPRPRVVALRKAIDAVLRRATGSRYTDDDTVTLDVYDREGLPCRRCRTPIERVAQAGRSTYFCPSCQPREPAASRKTVTSKSTARGARRPRRT